MQYKRISWVWIPPRKCQKHRPRCLLWCKKLGYGQKRKRSFCLNSTIHWSNDWYNFWLCGWKRWDLPQWSGMSRAACNLLQVQRKETQQKEQALQKVQRSRCSLLEGHGWCCQVSLRRSKGILYLRVQEPLQQAQVSRSARKLRLWRLRSLPYCWHPLHVLCLLKLWLVLKVWGKWSP